MYTRNKLLLTGFSAISLATHAQMLTPEDSLNAGLIGRDAATVVSGYGEVMAQYHTQLGTATANLTRAVLFVGHRFNDRITFLSELEVENAVVAGGEEGGELALEQLLLKFDLGRDLYLIGGLFTPRIGIINENHLPTTYHGNERPLTETLVIPATWREIGVCLYGRVPRAGGLNWSFGLMNGLDAGHFENGSGIRGGRYEGSNASASNLAITGSLLDYHGPWRFQASAYYGGSAGITIQEADSLALNNGPFGTPVGLVEGDAQFNGRVVSGRLLGSFVTVPDAEAINDAYGNDTPEAMLGGYAELSIDLLEWVQRDATKELHLFARYEHVDLEWQLPGNAVTTGTNVMDQWMAGISFLPVHGVVIKADVVVHTTSEPALEPDPNETGSPLFPTNTFLNVGFGYSF